MSNSDSSPQPVITQTPPVPPVPDTTPQPRHHIQRLLYTLILFCLFGIAGALGYYYWQLTHPKPEESAVLAAIPTPTPTPIQLHQGIGSYSISHGKTNGPLISKAVFNPLDVRQNQPLMLSVQFRSDTTVSSVTGTLQTDSSQTGLTFTKTSETGGLQVWSADLTVTDTLWYTYIVTIKAVNTTGVTTVTVAPRS